MQADDFSFLTTFSTSLNDSNNANEQGKTRTEQALKFMQENKFEFVHLANWLNKIIKTQCHYYQLRNQQNKTEKPTAKPKIAEQSGSGW